MKIIFYVGVAILQLSSLGLIAQPNANTPANGASGHPLLLFIDVHHLGAGNVTAEAVAKAHAKDLAVEGKYGVHFLQYWVDEAGGNVYCLSSSPDSHAIRQTHAEAHGLLPSEIYIVTDGPAAAENAEKNYYLDIHEFASAVSPADVAAAHQKDLAVEGKQGVNFINYWVSGNMVVCLSQAPDADAVIETHREAHGLLPSKVIKVTPGGK
ncbi:MAG TPA: DUF4242 domain-containing protein [Puia sp.]|nr:DUF4242 domain-containing protein [Puia sp.]